MSTLKKVLALTLALAMVMSLGVFAAFKDQTTIDADCVDSVQLMADLGIMTGDNGNAKPLTVITRAEAAAMIFRLMTGKTDASMYNGGKYFTDVPAGSWYEGYVNYCFTMGIINGRTATSFVPNAPVTGYEIAKMLLVCCGYNVAKQNYTGSAWAANVQNDAFNAGMLENFGMSMSAPAQRQWVAVMFNDALNCNTVKYLLGELTDISLDGKSVTLGSKKFGMTTTTGVVTAINGKASILAGTVSAEEGYTTVNTTGTTTVNFKKLADTSLLGQQVSVLSKAGSSTVYSIRATSKNKVGTAMLCDASYSSTTSKYTVGTLTAALDTGAIMFTNKADATVENIASETALKLLLKTNSAAPIVAIDNDNDGKIEVVMVTVSRYNTCAINSNGYVTLTGVSSSAYSKDDAAKYLNYVNTVANKDIVKVTANIFTGKQDIEALTAKTGLLNSIVSGTYTLGGTGYDVAVEKLSAPSVTLGKDVTFYTDGKFLVKADNTTGTVATMPTNLVLVTALGSKTDSTYGAPVTTNLVKVVGLDGKITEYVCANAITTTETADEWADLTVDTVYAYTIKSDGSIKLSTPTLPTGVSLSSVGAAELNISKKSISTFVVASDAKLFVKYSSTKYTVMSMADFTKTQNIAGAKLYTQSVSGLNTAIGGFVTFAGSIAEGTTSVDKYVIATANSYESSDGTNYCTMLPVMYMDGTTGTLITAKDDVSVGAGLYTKNSMYCVSNVDAKGISTVVDCFKTTTNNDQFAANLTDITGVSGKLVQITKQGLVTLSDSCNVIVVTKKADGTTIKSIAANGNVADLFVQTGLKAQGYTYASIKGVALTNSSDDSVVADTSIAKSVTLLYVEVVLNVD